MYKMLFLLFISLFFISCGPKNSAFRYFEKKDIETRGVQFTKKTDLLKDEEVSVIFMATYLNKVDKKLSDTKNEIFLIFTYFSNAETQSIKDNSYKFLLNGKEPIFIEKVEKENENFKDLMLKNNWGNYYLVKFDLIDGNNLKLVLTNEKSSKGILDFQK
ncbi:hypothetical protein [Arcobacter sp. L]|uniref:hypothetical protein n=1 Tax=Arcobacter sp. L TaxID=944547 RepID=UPI0002295F92|nr:hypothetical protein [Arcobacter sp. L]BAK73419.1 conserved hypothetical protein [Arcobacter sp. L]